jgi:TFIIF-interacting CTD phosphatase-like protein
MKHLYILDLDNTLIYGTGEKNLPAKVLLHYSGYTIYERPHAREFVKHCQQKGDVVVFTTAVRDYAEKVCSRLDFEPVQLFSREDCGIMNFRYVKSVPDKYYELYSSITIIDDLPEVWDEKSHAGCRIIGVTPFMGYEDDELLKIKNKSLK